MRRDREKGTDNIWRNDVRNPPKFDKGHICEMQRWLHIWKLVNVQNKWKKNDDSIDVEKVKAYDKIQDLSMTRNKNKKQKQNSIK